MKYRCSVALALALLITLEPLSPVVSGGARSPVAQPARSTPAVAEPGSLTGNEANDLRSLLRELLGGLAERRRVRDAAAELERVDGESFAVWDKLVATLPPPPGMTAADRDSERRRRAALYVFGERQAEYRTREAATEADLLARGTTVDTIPFDRRTLQISARLAGLYAWSETQDGMLQVVRAQVLANHAFFLASSGTATSAVPAAVTAELGQHAARRRQAEAALDAATTAWETARDTARQQTRAAAQRAAREVASHAAHLRALSDELGQRATRGLAGSTDDEALLRALAVRTRETARDAALWASTRAGAVSFQRDSFVFVSPGAERTDPALAALVARRARIVQDLLTALEHRVRLVEELRSLAQQRERLFAGSEARLSGGPGASTGSELATRMRAQTGEQWKRMAQLRRRVDPIAQASRSQERAAAAEALGAVLEQLVRSEQTLLDAETAIVGDYITPPDERKGVRGSPAWQADLSAIQGLEARWNAWRARWNRQADAERPLFAALAEAGERLQALWLDRLGAAGNAMRSASTRDAFGTFVVAASTAALREASETRRTRAAAHAADQQVDDDPILGMMVEQLAPLGWQRAAVGGGGLPRMEFEAAWLARVPREVAAATDASRAPARRAWSVMAISEALRIPWTLRRAGGRLEAVATVEARDFVLQDVESPGAVRLSVTGPTAGPRLLLAVSDLIGPPPAWAAPPAGPRAPPSETGVIPTITEAAKGAGEECFQVKNLAKYGLVVVVAGCAAYFSGGALGPPVYGALGAAVGIDAGAGAIKGGVKGATTDPKIRQFVTETVDNGKVVIELYQGAKGLQSVIRYGAQKITVTDPGKVKKLVDALARMSAHPPTPGTAGHLVEGGFAAGHVIDHLIGGHGGGGHGPAPGHGPHVATQPHPPVPPTPTPTPTPTPALTLVRLAVQAPASVAACQTAEFRAVAYYSDLPNVPRDVTGQASWSFSGPQTPVGGNRTKANAATTPGSITATASFGGMTSNASAAVNPAPIAALTVAAPSTANPGDRVPLTATATYGSGDCTRDERVTDQVQWRVGGSASVSGSSLQIAADKPAAPVTVSATLGSVASNSVTINVAALALKRLEVTAPASVPVCQTVDFRALAYYAHKPDEAKDVTSEATWRFAGPATPAGGNRAKAEWPKATITASASFGGKTAQRSVRVGDTPQALFFDSSFTALGVGESKKNVLAVFYCNGTRHDHRAVDGVQWKSAQPNLLACAQDGTCKGVAPGKAAVTWSYRGYTGTPRHVEVSGQGQASASPATTGSCSAPLCRQKCQVNCRNLPGSSGVGCSCETLPDCPNGTDLSVRQVRMDCFDNAVKRCNEGCVGKGRLPSCAAKAASMCRCGEGGTTNTCRPVDPPKKSERSAWYATARPDGALTAWRQWALSTLAGEWATYLPAAFPIDLATPCARTVHDDVVALNSLQTTFGNQKVLIR